MLVWVWFELFFIESYCPMWCPSSIGDGVSRLQSELYIYFLPILQPTFISYNTFKHIIRICTFVAKQPNKKTIHMKQHTVDPRWLWEATQTSKQHEIHQTTPIGACSQGKEKKQNNLEMACWNHPNLIPHTVLFISILQFDLRGDIQIDIPKSTNKWFTIGPCSEIRDLIRSNDSRLFDSNKTIQQDQVSLFAAAVFFLWQILPKSAPWQGLLTLLNMAMPLLPQGKRHIMLLNLLLALINSSTHCFYNCWWPLWASTFLDIKFWCSNAATSQPRWTLPLRPTVHQV